MSDMRNQNDFGNTGDAGGNTLERDRITRGEVGENDLDAENDDMEKDDSELDSEE